MAKRLVGEVHEREAADASLDVFSIGLAAWGHRTEISRIITLVRPIIDVLRLQLPEIIPLVKGVLAAVWPGMSRDLASNGVILIPILVADIQRVVGVEPDGIYGKDTEAAVRRWQIKRGGLLPDGWAGIETVLEMGPELRRIGK